MLIKIIAYVPAIIGLLIIGLFVFVNNPKDIRNKIFGLFNLLSSLWLLSQFFADISKNEIVALWSFRFALFFGQLVPYAFFSLAMVFPYKSKFNKIRQIIYGALYVVIAILSLTSLNVSTVKILDYGVLPSVVGPLYAFSDYLSILLVVIGIVILIIKYRRPHDFKEKSQLRLILLGISLVLIANIFSGIVLLRLVKNDSVGLLIGDFALLIFSLLVAYAIVKHGLFNVRLIVARTIGYLLSLGAIVGLYSLIVFGVLANFINNKNVGITQQLIYISLAVIVALTFPPIKTFFDKLSNKIFYRDAYEPQQLLDELNKVLVSTIELNTLLKSSAEVIGTTLKADFCLFAIKEIKNVPQRVIGTSNIELLANDADALRAITSKMHQSIIVTDELEEQNELKIILRKYDISMVGLLTETPNKQVEGLGYLLLGTKKSGNIYTEQDARIIDIITDELVIAIQNALRFEEIQQFNITLQQKIDDATHQLRKANDKLKALDETKDEFISMASHQLRTPLTSVKGYVSMVLEGDAGKLSTMQKKLLDQAFVSSQRMVYLIADLLNVSRLRTGKFVIENKPTNLADVVEGEISQLIESAKSRNLEMTYVKPKNFPSLMLDETKIRQVIMNFADNAIYYTPANGHISVNLIETPQSVEFTVVDDGIGVPKAEQHHMFGKFYRAGNAKKARPDGTGLGLFMAKKVIATQGGAIIFSSEEGKGSTFGFSFPKAKLTTPKT